MEPSGSGGGRGSSPCSSWLVLVLVSITKGRAGVRAGGDLPARSLEWAPKVPGLFFIIPVIDKIRDGQPADRRRARRAPGRHHEGQRHEHRRRRRLLPGRGPGGLGGADPRLVHAPRSWLRRPRCAPSSVATSSTSSSPSATGSTASCSSRSMPRRRRGASRCTAWRSATSRLPEQMQRAMARQAEAERERRARSSQRRVSAGRRRSSARRSRPSSVRNRSPRSSASPDDGGDSAEKQLDNHHADPHAGPRGAADDDRRSACGDGRAGARRRELSRTVAPRLRVL